MTFKGKKVYSLFGGDLGRSQIDRGWGEGNDSWGGVGRKYISKERK